MRVRLTGRAGATAVRRDTDAVEEIQSRNTRSTVEADVLAGRLRATRWSTVLGHAEHRQ